MDVNVLALFIPIISILVTGAAVIYYLWAQNKERLAMIEKGVDPSKFIRTRPVNNNSVAKWGLLLIGVAVGIIVGAILQHFTKLDEGALMFASILLFGGLGLLTYYFTVGKKSEQKGE
ncbi:MAG: hypothetical protein PWR03_112 [Tenuifilum sp.]|jgi:ABC-type Fe3+-siderophore transport system permease subunit|uniref:DUF6249 domain-containing protein n=1 Tax=Tenuifilum sp. TaxID=2760880 RepID=UPI0024AAB315|nr:DUF6249 domain-containing protein [Tenuifilum sp.]MDI3525929.1 hypothetical protein [Tenuifilum sp.]